LAQASSPQTIDRDIMEPPIGGKELVWGPHDVGYVVHTMAASENREGPLRLACGSFRMEAENFVDIFEVDTSAQEVVRQTARLPHYFPATRTRWIAAPPGAGTDLVVTSGDRLRIWSVTGELRSLLAQEANPQGFATPITSTDASVEAGSVELVSVDVYGVCSLWDAERGQRLQALDLGQPLSDVAFGPGRLIVASGDRGHCFVMDPRKPEDAAVLESRSCSVSGPSRVVWPRHRHDALAVAWQSGESCIALYTGLRQAGSQVGTQQRILSRTGASVAELQWSSTYPEFLFSCKEDGVAEMWHVGAEDAPDGVHMQAPAYQWNFGREEACTALAVSGKETLLVATMSKQAKSNGGSLWIAGLPQTGIARPVLGGS